MGQSLGDAGGNDSHSGENEGKQKGILKLETAELGMRWSHMHVALLSWPTAFLGHELRPWCQVQQRGSGSPEGGWGSCQNADFPAVLGTEGR